MPTYEQELLTSARAVARLQHKRRKLKKELKQVAADLRHEQKMLRGLAQRTEPDVAPCRLFGGATGFKLHDETQLAQCLQEDKA